MLTSTERKQKSIWKIAVEVECHLGI